MKIRKIRKPQISKAEIKSYFLELLGITAGCLIMAVSLNMFQVPNFIVPGGISGIGVFAFHIAGIPIGLTIIVLNIPLFVATYYLLGPRLVVQSLVGTLIFSLIVDLTAPIMPPATDDLLLAAVYGGVIMGLGVGLVFRFRSSTGGTALLSLILAKAYGISPGQALLFGDLVVLVLAIFVFGSEPAMYSALSLFISIKVVDAVLEGLGLAKQAIIITRSGAEINDRLLSELGRGVTRIEGQGGYTGEGREVLLCVVTRQQTGHLKAIIHEVDPSAFVIIGNATEVHGEGFKRMQQS